MFSWRYNPLWLYFHSPVASFSLLIRGFVITYNGAPQPVESLGTRPQKGSPALVYSISGEKESALRLGLFEIMTPCIPSFT
jgi:hypothetical protein